MRCIYFFIAVVVSRALFASPFVPPHHPGLSLPSEEVLLEEMTSDCVQALIEKMFDVAAPERSDGNKRVMVGLAAPQIGVFKHVILVDVGNDPRALGELKVYINPKIIWKSDEMEDGREGCYSVDCRICGIVPRAAKIRITAYDLHGLEIQEELSGFAARVFQHEVDHLHGIRFPDVVARDGGILQWVEEKDFPEYRLSWQTWPHTVTTETWEAMKQAPCD